MKRRSLAALAVCVLIVCAGNTGAQTRTRVVVLGSGTPNADPDRYGPAVAVVVDDASYLVDAGVESLFLLILAATFRARPPKRSGAAKLE